MKATQFIYTLNPITNGYNITYLYHGKTEPLSAKVPISFNDKSELDSYLIKNLNRFNILTKTHLEVSNFLPPNENSVKFETWVCYLHCYLLQKKHNTDLNEWNSFLSNASITFDDKHRGYAAFFQQDRQVIFDYIRQYNLENWIFAIVASLNNIRVDHNDNYRKSNLLDPIILYNKSKHGETFSCKTNYLASNNKIEQFYNSFFVKDGKCTLREINNEVDTIAWFNQNILSLKHQKEVNRNLVSNFIELCILNGVSKKDLIENELSKYYQNDNIYSHTIFELLLDANWSDIKIQIDLLNTIGYQSKISFYLMEQFNKEIQIISSDFDVDTSLFS